MGRRHALLPHTFVQMRPYDRNHIEHIFELASLKKFTPLVLSP
jgi:hypothetical protein